MRRKPVTRSEIRLVGLNSFSRRIATVPVDAVRQDDRGRLVPIAKLWTPLLQELTEQRKRKAAELQEWTGRPQEPPEPMNLPSYIEMNPRRCTCRRCGREFYQATMNGRYCSDDCAKASWRDGREGSVAAASKARSEERAAARSDRRCAHCNEPITAQRSTGKFCSVRCRVAAHRERMR